MNQLTEFLVNFILEEDKNEIIGIYGGGFKPPIKGHLEVLQGALDKYPEMDEVIVSVGSGVRDEIDQAEFTKESAEAGEFLVYSVGKMEADDMSFELDTDLTSQSPKGINTMGVGEGWGGIFRINPTKEGYEVRNAEKGGLVAMIDNEGNFRMLSADESRDELYGET